jgi:UDP-glucose 4-epimerase
MSQRILVTGGAGFIGSHLSERLLNDGNTVMVIDDLTTGSIDNILHLKVNQNFKYYLDTILRKSLLLELIDEADTIFHLAAAVGVELIIKNPTRTIETNIRGTDIVLDLAQKKNKKVIVTSTSEVYGKSNKQKFKEDDDLILGPTTKSRWSYAASKIIDEFLALAYYKDKGVPVVIFRLFNIVGPRQTGQYGMVLPRFVKQALSNQPITVYGDGSQTRTFLHVYDAVNAFLKVISCPESCGNIYNIGGDEEISILSLAKTVKTLLDSSSEIIFVPYSEAYEKGFEDMHRRVPDVTKINSLTGWKQELSLEKIIKDIAGYQLNKGQL